MTTSDIYVDRVLNDLHIRSIHDLHDIELIAFGRNADVIHLPLNGCEARLVASARRGIITVSTKISHERRLRFAIAHELGHFEMHRYLKPLWTCSAQDFDNWKQKGVAENREREANEFAAALLMPKHFFAPLCKGMPPSLDCVTTLSDQFLTSLTATALRFVTFTEEPCTVVFSKGGVIEWFYPSQEFRNLGLFVNVHSRLDEASIAARLLQENAKKSVPCPVLASAWLAPGPYDNTARVREQSLVMTNLDSVLTMLWIDEDLSSDDWGL